MNTRLLPLVIAVTALAPSYASADSALEARVERLERVLSQQSLSDAQLQIQRLQQEVRDLRGQVELQQHEIATLKQQVRDQYLDLESRLGSGAAAPAPAAGGAEPPAAVAAVPAPAATPAPAPSPAGEKEAYNAAFDLLKQRKYDEAIRAFQDLIARWPSGDYTDNAHYWLGETYYVKRDYPAALSEFQRVLADHPKSPKVPGAMLKVGYVHYDQGDFPAARAALQDVIAKHPDTTESRLAQSRLDKMAKDGRR